jgi:hypothetical protein
MEVRATVSGVVVCLQLQQVGRHLVEAAQPHQQPVDRVEHRSSIVSPEVHEEHNATLGRQVDHVVEEIVIKHLAMSNCRKGFAHGRMLRVREREDEPCRHPRSKTCVRH